MATVASYERPRDDRGRARALGRPGAIPLGGGTALNARADAEPVATRRPAGARARPHRASSDGGRLRIGAGVTLQALVEHPAVPQAVREAARRELPSTLRAAATVGGCVALAEPDSELFAALLVHDAVVWTQRAGGLPSLACTARGTTRDPEIEATAANAPGPAPAAPGPTARSSPPSRAGTPHGERAASR